jgi:hypothetical protein
MFQGDLGKNMLFGKYFTPNCVTCGLPDAVFLCQINKRPILACRGLTVYMVAVAQEAERRICNPVVAGSWPARHPQAFANFPDFSGAR